MSDKYPGGFVTANAPAGFSVAFDGSGDNLTWSGTAIGSGSYTVECWFYATSYTTYTTIIGALSGGTNAFALYINSATQIQVDHINVGNVTFTVPSMATNAWHHLAVTRSSTSLTVFVDGVRSSTGVVSNSSNYSNSSVSIGYSAGAAYFPGYLSNLRIVTGTAVYDPTATTINVPTQLFPVTNTSLLTCQSPTIRDNSANNFTITANGDAKVSNFTPFAAFSGSLVPRTSPQTASGVWTIDEAAYFTTQGLWPTAPDVPQKSLRFNSADSAYLNRTPTTASNRSTWTWSGWVKRSDVSSNYFMLFSAINGSNRDYITFDNSNRLNVDINNGISGQLISTQVFRDVGAWYHIVIAFDSTSSISANRIIAYVNGVQVTAFASYTAPSLNYQTGFDNNVVHKIGDAAQSGGFYFSGYMTEINFIDGQQLGATAFGAFEGGTGVWSPAPYNGTYGTNGFYLRFFDNSNTTAATLGKDSSPNGNNWTPNNFSVTAGVGNDSLLDTPNRFGTDTGVGGQVGGNYAVLNALDNGGNTLTDGNLSGNKGGGWASTRATIAFPTTGKWYWEAQITAGGNNMTIGIATSAAVLSGDIIGRDANGWGYVSGNGNKWTNGSGASYGATWTVGDIMGIAFDADAGTLTFYKNNTSQGIAFSSLTGGPYFPGVSFESTTGYVNFGQRPFAYTAPSGFKALVSTNLPTPAVGASNATLASKNFNISLYTGNGSTQNITGVGFQPDFVWIKSRSNAYDHQLIDAVRGAGKELYSNLANVESTLGTMPSFLTDGFSVSTVGGVYAGTNGNGATFVGWQWNAGGSTVTNTSGSISSQVRANPTAGISVVTYTGNGTSGATVGHGIGSAVQFIIVKQRGTGGGGDGNWLVGATAAIGWTGRLILNGTQANEVNSSHWNNTAPTSSVFTLGNSGNVNGSTGNYVAYCFAEVAGFSKFGSYTGNGSSDGPFVYCGFRPRFVIVKNSSDAGVNWLMFDTSTNPYNVLTKYLLPNSAVAEQSDLSLDILSNGFKPRVAGGTGINSSGSTYIFIAFAEAPFNYSRAR